MNIPDCSTLESNFWKISFTLPQYTVDNLCTQDSRLCLSLISFQSAFDENHEHSHAVLNIAQNSSNQYFYIPFLQKRLSVFIHDCFVCQRKNYKNMKQRKAAILPWTKLSSLLNSSISMDTRIPLNTAPEDNHYINIVIEYFSNYNVTVRISKNIAKYTVHSMFHPWICKFGPPLCLFTDRGSKYLNTEFAKICIL